MLNHITHNARDLHIPEQPIKVCFPFIGDEVGGSHISALKLIRNLDPKRIDPIIVLHQNNGVLAEYIGQEGMRFACLPALEVLAPRTRRGAVNLRAWDYIVHTVPSLRRFLIANRVQIVHTNDGQIHSTWALPARLSGAKLLWHHRADPNARGVNYIAPILANQIVTVSRFSRPRRPVLPVAYKLSVVHSPFEHPISIADRNRAKAAILSELGYPPETRLLGFFGGLIERKRPVLFVDIVHEFRNCYPDIPVAGLLFGENAPGGPALDVAVRIRAIELGIANRVHLMGFRRPIEPFIAGVDAMLVPAVNEPFGRTLIEAMLLGTPVIATDHGGNPEAVEHGVTGFLVEAERAEAFVGPLHDLMTSGELMKTISESARLSALTKYGVSFHVDELTTIYESLIKP